MKITDKKKQSEEVKKRMAMDNLGGSELPETATNPHDTSSFFLESPLDFCPSWLRSRPGVQDHNLLVQGKPMGSGGMPWSHTATVTALSMAVGLKDGFAGSTFAVASVLASMVLNQIVCELPAEHPLAESRPLRELLGHTPTQVFAGALLGLVTAITNHLIFGS